MKKQIAWALCTLGAAGCASTRPAPAELVEARSAYNKAAATPGAALVMVDIHKAEGALADAEKAWKADDENPRAIDLAYVAQRKAELAEALGEAALATQEQAEAEKAIAQSHADSAVQRNQELDEARKQLAAAQSETKVALAQLKSLKGRTVKQEDRGMVITLSGSVLFQSNKADLMPTAKGQLSDIAHALIAAKGQKIAIEGYTDASGPKERNELLSQQRAESVMKFLINTGLPATDIRAVGRGPENPIADNGSAEGRATNRRVEIVVQAEGKAPEGT